MHVLGKLYLGTLTNKESQGDNHNQAIDLITIMLQVWFLMKATYYVIFFKFNLVTMWDLSNKYTLSGEVKFWCGT